MPATSPTRRSPWCIEPPGAGEHAREVAPALDPTAPHRYAGCMRASLLVVTMLVVSAFAAPAAAATPATITVLYFDNDTGDASLAYLGKGLADMMITDL